MPFFSVPTDVLSDTLAGMRVIHQMYEDDAPTTAAVIRENFENVSALKVTLGAGELVAISVFLSDDTLYLIAAGTENITQITGEVMDATGSVRDYYQGVVPNLYAVNGIRIYDELRSYEHYNPAKLVLIGHSLGKASVDAAGYMLQTLPHHLPSPNIYGCGGPCPGTREIIPVMRDLNIWNFTNRINGFIDVVSTLPPRNSDYPEIGLISTGTFFVNPLLGWRLSRQMRTAENMVIVGQGVYINDENLEPYSGRPIVPFNNLLDFLANPNGFAFLHGNQTYIWRLQRFVPLQVNTRGTQIISSPNLEKPQLA